MNNILFSIIIPTYNRANTIKRCLDSVINQTYTNWEAIVVDNYSNDNTEEIITSYNDKRIHFYKNHNYGVIAVSRNYAMDRANGDWYCFLDSDDYWDKTKLKQILRYVNDYDLIYHGYRTNFGARYLFKKDKKLFYTVTESSVSYVLQRSDPFSPSCSAVSAKFLGDLRFDESKNMFAIEDYDFFLQIMTKTPRIKHLKKYLAFYDESTGISHNQSNHLDRSRVVYIKYKSLLNRNEFRNVLRLYMFMKGIMYVNISPSKARGYFLCSFKSSACLVKYWSIKWLVMTFIFQIRLFFYNIKSK